MTIPPKSFAEFERVLDPEVFAPVADEAWLGMTDVVGSTAAIARGGYKAVNMAGAAVISAMMNALPGVRIAFVFGGDGASFVVDDKDEPSARETLARTVTWAAEELGLEMRAALIPAAGIRQAGHDLRVAWYQASKNVSYAMLSGGGAEWGEREMKSGRFAVPPAAPGKRPDLEGLSCRWQPLASRNGKIVSLIVRRSSGGSTSAFAAVVRDILGLVHSGERDAGSPVSLEGLRFKWPPAGLDLEARSLDSRRPLFARKAILWAFTLLAFALFKLGLKAGAFDPARYRREVAQNSDFRKFDDGLRMTIDCSPETLGKIEERLGSAAEQGIVEYGLHGQSAALMTCIVPSATASDHLHFVDGAEGGYAKAAEAMKRQAGRRE
ncbi:MAG: DUF3095 domain-containing protein [Hyphomicrobiaceae bacterium]|nr:MAG: DUF3095 domain-containing protein [Hyphomicrobiaceae bacterium]